MVRDEEGKRHTFNIEHTELNTRPYFFADPADYNNVHHLIPDLGVMESDRRDLFGRNIIKVCMRIPSDVAKAREKFKWTCEADIEWRLRTLIDLGIKLHFEKTDKGKLIPADTSKAKLNHGYVDIEVAATGAQFPDIEKAEAPVVFIALHDWYHDEPIGLMLKNPKWGDTEPWRHSPYSRRLILFDDEAAMLECCFQIIRDGMEVMFSDGSTEFFGQFDTWTGWNVSFDIGYLYYRAKRIGVEPNNASPLGYWYTRGREDWRIGGIEVFDGLTAVKKWNESEADLSSWSYQFVKGHFLGQEYNRTSSGGVIPEVWEKDVLELVRYGIEDAADFKVLFEKLNIWAYFDSIRQLVGVSYKDALSNLKVVNTWILRKAKSMGVCLPTLKYEQKQVGAKGAAVFQPPPGLHEWVGVADVKSLYPTLIKTFNMSPETIVPDPIEFRDGVPYCDSKKWIHVTYPVVSLPNGIRFRIDIKGILPLIVEEAEQWRDEFRTLEKKYQIEGNKTLEALYWTNQNTAKYLNSSIYGVQGNEAFILRSDIERGCITYMGREIVIPAIKEFLELHHIKAIYADTDSNFFTIPEVKNFTEAEHKGEEIVRQLNIHLAEKIGTSKIYAKLDKVFEIMLFALGSSGQKAAKKNYAGLKKDGTINIMGFPAKRSDSSPITQKVQKALFDILLKDRDIPKATDMIRDVRKKFLIGDVDIDEISVPRGLGKPLSEYSEAAGKHAMIRGLEYAIENFKAELGTGSKPRYLYVKRIQNTSGLPNTDVITFEDKNNILPKFWEDFKIDYEAQFALTVQNKVQGIMGAVGVDWHEITTGLKKTTLDLYPTHSIEEEQILVMQENQIPADWDTRRMMTYMELDYGYTSKELGESSGLSERVVDLIMTRGRNEGLIESKLFRGKIWWMRVI